MLYHIFLQVKEKKVVFKSHGYTKNPLGHSSWKKNLIQHLCKMNTAFNALLFVDFFLKCDAILPKSLLFLNSFSVCLEKIRPHFLSKSQIFSVVPLFSYIHFLFSVLFSSNYSYSFRFPSEPSSQCAFNFISRLLAKGTFPYTIFSLIFLKQDFP